MGPAGATAPTTVTTPSWDPQPRQVVDNLKTRMWALTPGMYVVTLSHSLLWPYMALYGPCSYMTPVLIWPLSLYGP